MNIIEIKQEQFYLDEKNQKIMKKNMGMLDRILRVVIAAILVTLYFTNIVTGTIGIVLIALSGIFVLTSFMSFCPLYLPFGIRTCKKE